MQWNSQVEEKFKLMISKIPVFHRGITETAVRQRAEDNARNRGAGQIEEKDVISAFFSDVPAAFYSLMVRLLEQTGFDYKRYGFPKNTNSQP